MANKYKHLTQGERDRIEALLSGGHQQREIAQILGRNKGTISREIERNRRKKRKKNEICRGPYKSTVAQQKAYTRRKYSKYQGKKINEHKILKTYIINGLINGWSPDEISGRMNYERQPFRASKTAIYKWLYSNRGQYWCSYLYSQRYRPRKRKQKKTKKTLIPNRKGLELRFSGANNKTRYGHYECDTIVSGKKTGSKEALSVVYERKAKYIDIKKIKNLKPKQNNNAIFEMKNKLNKIISFTFDNGIENVKHEELNISTFFCDPYSSWQKGGIENANKMIRKYIPKGSDISNYSNGYVKMVVDILNNKPRKSLGYKTAREVMVKNNLLASCALEKQKPRSALVALRG